MYNKLVYKYQVTEDGLVFNIELAGKSKEDVKIFKEDYSIAIKVEDNKYRISYEDYLLRAPYILIFLDCIEAEPPIPFAHPVDLPNNSSINSITSPPNDK